MDTVFGEAVGGRQLNDEARPGRDTPMRAVDDEERPILDEDEHDDDRISLHEDLDDYSKAPSRRSKTVRKEISNALATWLTGLFGRKRSGAAADRNRGRGYAPVGQGD